MANIKTIFDDDFDKKICKRQKTSEINQTKKEYRFFFRLLCGVF